jgi:hypothetical protein
MDFLLINSLFVAVGCCVATLVFWELVFSPLRAFPGPLAARFTNIWRAIATTSGHIDRTNVEWHRQYGSAVRVGPNTISISDPNLIRTIYATKNAWPKVTPVSTYCLEFFLTRRNQSEMYKPNDVLINGMRMSNVFNTQDNAWHDKYMKPIRGLWTMTKVLGMESLIDETLSKFTNKLGAKFADGSNVGKVCMMDEWLGYCKDHDDLSIPTNRRSNVTDCRF